MFQMGKMYLLRSPDQMESITKCLDSPLAAFCRHFTLKTVAAATDDPGGCNNRHPPEQFARASPREIDDCPPISV